MHELVARSSAWRVLAANDEAKVNGFTTFHGFSHTTRANISHERAEQIRARIACTPAESARGVDKAHTLTGWRAYFLFLMFAVLRLYLVGVGVTLSRRRRHARSAYVSIPSTTRVVGANIVRPLSIIK